jgi:hypothetical protein
MNNRPAPGAAFSKLLTVTNVTLHWYSRGIQFPAAEAPQNYSVWSGHSCPLGLVSNGQTAPMRGPIQPSARLLYSVRPRVCAGSCVIGVPVCI